MKGVCDPASGCGFAAMDDGAACGPVQTCDAAQVCNIPHRLNGVEKRLSTPRDHERRGIVVAASPGRERHFDIADVGRADVVDRRKLLLRLIMRDAAEH